MVAPLVRVKSVKKKTNRFKRHQSDRKMAVKVHSSPGWRGDGRTATRGRHGRLQGAGGGALWAREARRRLHRHRCRSPASCAAAAMCCCRRAGGAPRVLTRACAGSSRAAASSCPTSATAPTRRLATRCPTVRRAGYVLLLLLLLLYAHVIAAAAE